MVIGAPGGPRIITAVTQVVLRVEPWYAPRYLLPIAGMLLGNAMNGIALGLDSTLAGFAQERERIELLLAYAIRRHHIDRVAQRTQQHAALAEHRRHFGRKV